MADSMAGYIGIARLEAAPEDVPQVEITEVLEDDYTPLDVNEGLKAPALDLQRPELIQRVLEDSFTFLHHVTATICDALPGWILRGSGSGSIKSPGQVHGVVALPDDQEIVKLEFCIMEELMMWDWIRNICSFLRKNGCELISLSDTHGWVYKHDSVVVKIADEGIWIKAEKGGESWPFRNDGGIKLEAVRSPSHPKDWKDPGDIDSGRYSVRFTAVIKLGGGKEKFTVKQLIHLLSSCHPNYNIFSANCWQYAFSSGNKFLIWNLENSKDEEVKGEIRQKLEDLAKLERPMPRDIFLALWNPYAPESEKVIVTFRQKLAGTFEGLPPNAKVRRFFVHGTQKFVNWRAPRREDMANDGESASLSTSSDAERPSIREPSVEDESGDVNEEYSEMMQDCIQPLHYVYSCSPSMMDSGPWMCTSSSVEPHLRQRKKKLPPNSSEGPMSGLVVA